MRSRIRRADSPRQSGIHGPDFVGVRSCPSSNRRMTTCHRAWRKVYVSLGSCVPRLFPAKQISFNRVPSNRLGRSSANTERGTWRAQKTLVRSANERFNSRKFAGVVRNESKFRRKRPWTIQGCVRRGGAQGLPLMNVKRVLCCRWSSWKINVFLIISSGAVEVGYALDMRKSCFLSFRESSSPILKTVRCKFFALETF